MAVSKKTSPPESVSAAAAFGLARLVSASLTRHLQPGVSVRMALSGGVDSVVLLHILHGLAPDFPFKLSAIHVHHGLSPSADGWAGFCQSLCLTLAVPFECVKVKVARESSTGLEAAARQARYGVLFRPGADVVALAHHLDDQAETVLFHFLRGGEPRALAAMPEVRRQNGMLLWRPLLDVPKSMLMDYARSHQLAWVEDDSNADTALSRNALRQEVLPLLEKHFPDYRQRLSATARRMAEIAETLDSRAHENLPGDTLSVNTLANHSQSGGVNLLAAFLRRQCPSMPRPAALRELYRQIIHANGRLVLPLPSGYCLLREGDQLRVARSVRKQS